MLSSSLAAMPAHPRSRGENTIAGATMYTRSGSSPLTRGKPHNVGARLAQVGLIPAHAGKTRRNLLARLRAPAHPRSRGENLKQVARDVNRAGSSPLTRGKPARARDSIRPARLIPAHAGKTPIFSEGANCG